ncbi:MAG: Type secretion system protein virB2 precursor [Pseudomonadota bacterium]|jgi:type IV secretion system protein VirB2
MFATSQAASATLNTSLADTSATPIRHEPVWLRALLIVLIAATLSLCLPLLAHAGIPSKPATIVTNIVTMLTGLGVGLFTAACMWTGYKMAFAGAQFRDVSNILWGGVLAGGAAGFAGWLFG